MALAASAFAAFRGVIYFAGSRMGHRDMRIDW